MDDIFKCTRYTLRWFAFLIWFSGAVILSYKSSQLFSEALMIIPDQVKVWLSVFIGLLIGSLKAKYLFKKVCIKNLNRINSLEKPKVWQSYRTGFYFFLLTMIILGGFISHQAHGHYAALMVVAIIEVSLATALLLSGSCFWGKNQLIRIQNSLSSVYKSNT